MDLASQDVHTYVETWQGLRDIPRFTKRAMESLIPTDGLSSSFTPCSAALHPDIMLRDKYYTASDQNIIVWIPNIIYCSTRDVRGTIWSSNMPLPSGVCLPREILTERLLYLLYFSTHIWGKGDIPLPSGGQTEKTYWEENPWDGTGFFIIARSIATSSCPVQSVTDLTKHMDVTFPHRCCH